MNKKSRWVLRLILGGYLVFLGVSVLVQARQTQPGDLIIKVLFGVLFIVVGVFYSFTQIKRMHNSVKKESGTNSDSDAMASTQPLFEKPQHNQSLYRTAPMPTEGIRKKIPAHKTNLRANVGQVSARETDLRVNAGQISARETDLQANMNRIPEERLDKTRIVSQLNIQVEERGEEKAEIKDPVKLAIEIMQDEEDNTAETAEELEKDYEEK